MKCQMHTDNFAKEVIRSVYNQIKKKRKKPYDEYLYPFEISQNSKGEAQLTAKIRMDKLDSGAAMTFDYL
jgi:hypothetical protein